MSAKVRIASPIRRERETAQPITAERLVLLSFFAAFQTRNAPLTWDQAIAGAQDAIGKPLPPLQTKRRAVKRYADAQRAAAKALTAELPLSGKGRA